jgi:hypothetical protein
MYVYTVLYIKKVHIRIKCTVIYFELHKQHREREREKNKGIEKQKSKQDIHTMRDVQELRLSQGLCSLWAYVN